MRSGFPDVVSVNLAAHNQQPEAKTGAPRAPRGTQLKATTNGLFWTFLSGIAYVYCASLGRKVAEEACFSLPGVRMEFFLPIYGRIHG
jgi:hypothetical protein